MKNFIVISFLITLLWALGATYVALDHPKVKEHIAAILNKPIQDLKSDINDEYTFVSNFLKDYYTLKKTDEVSKKVDKVSSYFRSYSNANLIERFRRNTAASLSNTNTSEVFIKKVFYQAGSDEYQALINLKQNKKEVSDTLLLKTTFKLSRSAVSGTKVLEFDEQLLGKPPKEFLEKIIFTKDDSIATVKLPCVSSAVRAVKNETGIELKLLSDRKTVQFFPKKDTRHSSEFKAACGKRVFKLQLASSQEKSTLHHTVAKAEGYIERTPEELFFMSVERDVRESEKARKK